MGYASVLGADELHERWTAKRAGAELAEFVRARVDAYLKELGIPYDVAEAVLPVTWERPGVAAARARDLVRLRGDASFERLVTGVKRVGNILPRERRRTGAAWDEVRSAFGGEGAFSPNRFEDPAEHALLDALRTTLGRIDGNEEAHPFAQVLADLSGLAAPIDAYFDKVLVNSPDPAVRDNRLAFLAATYTLFGRYADFQRLIESGPSSS